MKRMLGNLIVMTYIVITIAVTICLLSYNEYHVTELGDNTLIIIDDNSLQPEYKEGDLVVAKKGNIEDIAVGEKIFFYNNKNIKLGEVQEVNKFEGTSTTFILDGDHQVIEEDVIGSQNNAKTYNNIGKILGFLESKWGFLFFIIFPSVIAFLYEIFQVVIELQNKD